MDTTLHSPGACPAPRCRYSHDSHMETIGLMCNDAEVAQYQTEGLPADRVSAENGAIVLNTRGIP